jgi:hypothetical protein
MGLLTKVLSKLVPVPGVGFAAAAVKGLEALIDANDKKLLKQVRDKEFNMGGANPAEISSVATVVTGSTSISLEAIEFVSVYRACAWRAPNGLWVFHGDANYAIRWRPSGGYFLHAVGKRRKDGTWNVSADNL